jgi:hypothetical protein
MKSVGTGFFLVVILMLTTRAALAQGVDVEKHPFEAGGQIGFINMGPLPTFTTIADGQVIVSNQFDQTYAFIGGRMGYNITPHIALEAEGNYIPKRNFSEIEQSRKAQFLGGLKIGMRREKFGLFAKARPGVMHLSVLPSHTTCRLPTPTNPICAEESQTNFALDLGGVLEYYPSPRIVVRIDAGSTLVRFKEAGPTQILTSVRVTPADITHNFQASIGLSFRF